MDKKISIFEVGPRDGLQNIKNEIPINRKIELIDILSATGIKKIECGSFVSAEMGSSNERYRSNFSGNIKKRWG